MPSKVPLTKSQQDAIQIRGKDVLVSASAGAGKTFVLIERIIGRLLDPNDSVSLSNILVVTFTRNATAELKSRVAEALNDALQEDPSNETLSRELLLLGSAQISTIDAFLQKIVRDNFDKLGIPRAFRIISPEEEYPMAERVMQEALEGLYLDGKKLGTNGDDLFELLQGNAFAEAMGSLINHKDESVLRKTLIEFKKQFSKYPEGIELLKKSAEDLRADIGRSYFDTEAGKALKDYSEKWIERFSGNTRSNYVEFCAKFKEALKCGYEAVKAALTTFPAKSNSDYIQVAKLYSSFEEDIKEEKRRSAELADALYRLYTEYEKRLLEEKQIHGVLTFDDITALAYGLLKPLRDETRSSAAQTLYDHYTEVYIDEYQDVNRVQDEIFRLIGEGKRFMVGDIKQSIYRFRGGDPQVFADYRRDMPEYDTPDAEAAPGNSIFMRENFRCNSTIIDTANDVCAPLFEHAECSWKYDPERDNLVFHKKRDSLDENETQFQDEKTVQIHTLQAKDQEPIFVADEIARLLSDDENETKDNGERIKAEDIVILVRTNAQAKDYANALRERKIKVDVQADDTEVDPELVMLMNLLSAIDNPYKDLPLFEMLQSPFAKFKLEEISHIRKADQSSSLFDALKSYKEVEDRLGKKAKETFDFLEEQRKNASTLSVDRFLRKLYETPQFAWMKHSDIPVYLYSLARQYAANTYVGLFEFLNYFQKLCENGKLPANEFRRESGAVLITTIHKSKGAQYPVLFVTSLGADFSSKELQDSIFFSQELGFSAKLYDKRFLALRSTADCEVEKAMLKQKSREESLRLLYVAMTRAKERLYLTGVVAKTTQTQAENIKAGGGRYTVLNAVTSFMPWVLAFLDGTVEFPYHIIPEKLPEPQETTDDPAPGDGHDATSEGKPQDAKSGGNNEPNKPTEEPEEKDEPATSETALLQRLPSKVAASKIAPDLFDRLLDERDPDQAIQERLELFASAESFQGFLDESRQPNAAEIGSATHAFLEFCDFAALAKGPVEDEMKRLIAQGFLPKESESLIQTYMLKRFVKSELFRMILSAKEVLREQQFARLIPMKELTQNPDLQAALEGEEVFVQGSIDLLLRTETGWVLVDYKTDYSPKEESFEDFGARMLASHGSQLKTYAQAVKQLYSDYPEHIYLYSLPRGEHVEFSLGELGL